MLNKGKTPQKRRLAHRLCDRHMECRAARRGLLFFSYVDAPPYESEGKPDWTDTDPPPCRMGRQGNVCRHS